ncbi:hypothetical protein CW714_08850 [Methanophagales archaeon]|nr:MAG: hypothetical protein CW714_08850 [Methanophagales archaeon]
MKKGIGVAAVIAVVLIAIVLIALSSTASATSVDRNYTDIGGVLRYEGALDGLYKGVYRPDKAEKEKILEVYEGEKILFLNTTLNKSVTVTVSGPCEWDGEPYDEDEADNVPDGEVWDSDGKPTKGYYRVMDGDNYGGWFKVKKHSLTVELVGEKEKVQEGEIFTLKLKKNNRKQGVMKLTIEDDEGFSIEDEKDNDIYEALVRYEEKELVPFSAADNKTVITADKTGIIEGLSIKDKKLVFDTSKLKMKEGGYTIKLEDYATEAGDDADIEVEKRYLEAECEDDEVVKGEDIVIIITSSFYEETANVTVKDYSKKNKNVTLDKEGKKKVRISTENLDYGTHKITVEVCGMKETKYVKIKKSEVSLEELPEDAPVGDIVHIEGTSDFGDYAVFVIEDVFKGEARISDDEFEWDWDTEGELDGYHGIEVFILNEVKHAEFSANYSLENVVDDDWQRGAGVDASAGILLLPPEFSMTVPKNIAEGDDVVISGEATGTDHVYVIVMNHKGEVMFPEGGIAKATAVEDEEWEENIGELDSGRYTVIALYEGKDGVTDAIKKDGKWAAGDESKTLEQRVAILMDAITSAGSDDLFEKAYFTVSTPKISLKVPGTVEIGDAINVKAETNIREGEKAFISLSQNASIIKKTSVLVKNGGSVDANINTSGSSRLLPGRYNVAVDISGRASDEKEVILVEKKEEEQEGEEGKESMPQNESVTEPVAVAGANESVGESSGEINESQEGEERKIPVNVWDLLIAVIVAIFISVVVRRHR